MLANNPMTVNQISEHFSMSRPAVAKHLKILQKGKIIKIKTVGRSRVSTLQPKALKSVADWVNYYSNFWDEKLSSLKHTIERK
jgi:DNA-binding transcriptional ArsR family regulator